MALKVQLPARGSEILDIDIRRDADGVDRVVMRSPLGEQKEGPLRVTASAEEVEWAVTTATQLTESAARRGSASGAQYPLRDLGIQLFDALFEGSREGLYRRAMAYGREKGLRVVLRIHTEVAGVVELPWEFLHDGQDFVCLSDWSSVVRSRPMADPSPAPLPTDTVRLLVAIADLTGYMATDRDTALFEGLDKQQERLQVTVMEGVTRSSLLDALVQGEYHIVHFVGVTLDSRSGQPLALKAEGEGDSPVQAAVKGSGSGVEFDLLSAQDIVTTLQRTQSDLRLVVLSAPNSELLAKSITEAVPAAVGMRGSISIQASNVFAETLYRGVLGGRNLEQSVAMARQEIDLRLTGSREWGLPVAWLSHVDQVLWTAKPQDALEGVSFGLPVAEAALPVAGEHEGAWRKNEVLSKVFEMNLEALYEQRDTYGDEAPRFLGTQIADMQERLDQVQADQRALAGGTAG